MRRILVAGNWKMNLNRQQAVELARQLVAGVPTAVSGKSTEVVICPPAVYLEAVRGAVNGSSIGVGAQNASSEKNGAFTGEISLEMLADVGTSHVILGHSERRQFSGETDTLINRKLRAALESALTPILCLGETLEQREQGATQQVIRTQLEGALEGVSAEKAQKIVIAYEPVWAIGTGKTATPQQAQEVHADLRKMLENRYNAPLAQQIRLLYGGSVKADNAAELLAQPDIDGALVGGASLQAEGFLKIVAAAP
jgi:triosephosphate isomerase